jgi:ribosome-associated protein
MVVKKSAKKTAKKTSPKKAKASPKKAAPKKASPKKAKASPKKEGVAQEGEARRLKAKASPKKASPKKAKASPQKAKPAATKAAPPKAAPAKAPAPAPAPPKKPVLRDPALDLAQAIAALALDKKADDVVILRVTDLTSYADGFVLASAPSERQVQAIARFVDDEMRKAGKPPVGTEGMDQGHWVLVDLGAVVLHVFLSNARRYYDLEGFWSEAQRVDVDMPTATASSTRCARASPPITRPRCEPRAWPARASSSSVKTQKIRCNTQRPTTSRARARSSTPRSRRFRPPSARKATTTTA